MSLNFQVFPWKLKISSSLETYRKATSRPTFPNNHVSWVLIKAAFCHPWATLFWHLWLIIQWRSKEVDYVHLMDRAHKSIFQSVETTTVLIDGSWWIINESSESSIGYFILLARALESKRSDELTDFTCWHQFSHFQCFVTSLKLFQHGNLPHRETHLQHDRFMFQMTYL